MLASLETLTERRRSAERRLLSQRAPGRGGARRGLLALRRAGRVEIAGSARRWTETCKDIDLIATTDDAAALVAALAEHELVAPGRPRRRCRHQRAHPRRPQGRPADPHGGDLRQPASALHRLGRAQRRSSASGRWQRGLSVSEHGVAEGRGKDGPSLRRGGGRLRAARAALHRARAARGVGRDRGGRDRGAARAGHRRADPRRPALPHDPLGRAQLASRRWRRPPAGRGYAYLAITDHSASHGFGNDVTPRRSPSGSRRSAPGTRRRRAASGCWPAPR